MDRKEEIYKMADTLYPDEFPSSIGQRFGMITVDRSNEREIFIKNAKWADQTMIEKACKFLKAYRRDTPDGMGYIAGIVDDDMIEDFRKAMNE